MKKFASAALAIALLAGCSSAPQVVGKKTAKSP